MAFWNVVIVWEFSPYDTVDYLLRALFEGAFSRKIYLNTPAEGIYMAKVKRAAIGKIKGNFSKTMVRQ